MVGKKISRYWWYNLYCNILNELLVNMIKTYPGWKESFDPRLRYLVRRGRALFVHSVLRVVDFPQFAFKLSFFQLTLQQPAGQTTTPLLRTLTVKRSRRNATFTLQDRKKKTHAHTHSKGEYYGKWQWSAGRNQNLMRKVLWWERRYFNDGVKA